MSQNRQCRNQNHHIRQICGPERCKDLLDFFTGCDIGKAGERDFDQEFLERLCQICTAGAASIWKLNGRAHLELVLSTDITDPERIQRIRAISLTRGRGISGQAVLQSRTLAHRVKECDDFHDDGVDKITGQPTRSIISSPIVWGNRNVYGVVNVVNTAEEPILDQIKEYVEIAARLYAHALVQSGSYDAPSFEEVSLRYPALIYDINGPLARVVEACEMYAPYNDTVLLLGETGTGKELLADVIWKSSRRPGPLLTMNCGAGRHQLINSDLFGYVKGAFTGAYKNTEGFLGKVGKGTLFLDEIGNLPADCQPAFLRLLENRKYSRLGDAEPRTFEGRIIAATHPTLREKVQCGEFMEDLAYRLDRFVIDVPALRECLSDIPILLEHFLAEYAEKYSKNRPLFSRKALQRLMSYTWPGNVRQMQNVIRDAVVSFSGGEIDEVRLEGLLQRHSWTLSKATDNVDSPPMPQSAGTFEEQFRKACEDPNNRTKQGRVNISAVATAMGISTATVRAQMDEIGIVRPHFTKKK